MRELIPGLLWSGNAFDARDLKGVLDRRIEAVIDLAMEEPPVSPARELTYCRFPPLDGQGNSPSTIESAISTAVRFIMAKVPTLICCGGGMSRSPAIAAAVISQIDGIEPEDAMKRVASCLYLKSFDFTNGSPTHSRGLWLRGICHRRPSSANRSLV